MAAALALMIAGIRINRLPPGGLPSGGKPDRVASAMRSNLDHLPPAKQRELERVVQIIFEEFDDAFALASHEWKKKGRILKVILYGSYARGNWIDEPHTAKGYKSDYDLLIIVNDKRLTDRVKYWANVDDRLMREFGITGSIKTPVNFIVHSLQEVNDGLAHGRYFFMDVARDGIALYQSEDSELHQPKPKSPHAALTMAKEYFEEWMPTAQQFLIQGNEAAQRGWNNKAAFELHQAAERLYHCVLLVVTFYTPHVLHAARSQSGVPAHPGRTARCAPDVRLARRQSQAARHVRKAEGSLCEGALLEALPDQRRRADVAW